MSSDMVDAIRGKAEPAELPTGNPGLVINLNHIASIALAHGVPGWKVERDALKNGIIPKRYLRSGAVYGFLGHRIGGKRSPGGVR